MNPEAIALGRVIRTAAADSGLTMTALARRSGISRAALYLYMDGTRAIPVATLARIGHAADIPGWELMRRAATGHVE